VFHSKAKELSEDDYVTVLGGNETMVIANITA
jgi:hypothetical protein